MVLLRDFIALTFYGFIILLVSGFILFWLSVGLGSLLFSYGDVVTNFAAGFALIAAALAVFGVSAMIGIIINEVWLS